MTQLTTDNLKSRDASASRKCIIGEGRANTALGGWYDVHKYRGMRIEGHQFMFMLPIPASMHSTMLASAIQWHSASFSPANSRLQEQTPTGASYTNLCPRQTSPATRSLTLIHHYQSCDYNTATADAELPRLSLWLTHSHFLNGCNNIFVC